MNGTPTSPRSATGGASHTTGGRNRRTSVRGARRCAACATLVVLLAALACVLAAPQTASAVVSGAQLWRRVYNGPGSADDVAAALALAPGGTAVYVAGSITAADGVTTDLALIKYRSGGKRLWVRTYDGAFHQDDEGTAVVRDAKGNVYVGGWTQKTYSNKDFLLIKYDAAGHRKWVRTYDCAHGLDLLEALALDADGNVYGAGTVRALHVNVNFDAALAKWTPAGRRVWTCLYDGPADDGYDGDDDDRFTTLVVDKARGRIYAGGTATTAPQTEQWLLARYTMRGKLVWTQTSGLYDSTSLALAPTGAVLQAGSVPAGSFNYDAVVAEWTAAGAFAWSGVYAGTSYDCFNDLAVDRRGVVFAVGYHETAMTSNDALVCRFSPGGTLNGEITIGGYSTDEFVAVTCDSARNVYATGFETQALNDKDWMTVKLSNDLSRVFWQPRAREADVVHDDVPAAIAVRTGTNPGVFVTGYGARDATTWDWMTIKYQP